MVGATFGGPRVGIVNFERKVCPYQVTSGTWRHSVNGKLERDSGIVLKCLDPAAAGEPADGDAETVGALQSIFPFIRLSGPAADAFKVASADSK